MWFECARSAYPRGPGYYFADCNKEWARLAPHLFVPEESSDKISAAFRGEKEVQVSSSVELIKPGDVPKGLGYKAVVDWFDCVRGGGRSYAYGQCSRKRSKVFREGCTVEWDKVM